MLVDAFQRRIDYLRVSITDRCDMRCTYCMPVGFTDFEEPANWLSVAEMGRLVGLFVAQGVSKVRITGGEPLLRKGVVDFARAFSGMVGLQDLSLSTNGSGLCRHAFALRSAGVQRLNVSLDTLDPIRFEHITHKAALPQVLEGIDAANAAGFSLIKLNMVVQSGINDDEVEAMMAFAQQRRLLLRLIEPMPVGETGRAAKGINLTDMAMHLAARHGLMPTLTRQGSGPSRYWGHPSGAVTLGVITPLSQHFCATCNRVRLTVDGTLYLCLGQDHAVPLGRMLRDGASDQQLRQAIEDAIAHKPERHEFKEKPDKVIRIMSATGG